MEILIILHVSAYFLFVSNIFATEQDISGKSFKAYKEISLKPFRVDYEIVILHYVNY